MKLLTKELEKKLPPLYTYSETDPAEVPVFLKFFTPDSNWTWYVTEYDPEQRLFFGYVIGFERELGYFSLDELESVRGKLGLPIERDKYLQETTLEKVMNEGE